MEHFHIIDRGLFRGQIPLETKKEIPRLPNGNSERNVSRSSRFDFSGNMTQTLPAAALLQGRLWWKFREKTAFGSTPTADQPGDFPESRLPRQSLLTQGAQHLTQQLQGDSGAAAAGEQGWGRRTAQRWTTAGEAPGTAVHGTLCPTLGWGLPALNEGPEEGPPSRLCRGTAPVRGEPPMHC